MRTGDTHSRTSEAREQAMHAVQVALDRRDNGGKEADEPAGEASPGGEEGDGTSW
jgi:hypothetical protein